MNLLAHAYLSNHNPQLLLGNMIGDDVKGMQIRLFPPEIRAGIQLHRYIDSYTDQHPLIIEAKNIYRPAARLYAGPLIDITLDYFLANDPFIYSPDQWRSFAIWSYQALQTGHSWHVGGFRHNFPYLKKENWFIHYGEEAFIKKTLTGLLKRVGLADKSTAIISTFEQNQEYLQQVYQEFFPDLQQYTLRKTDQLTG